MTSIAVLVIGVGIVWLVFWVVKNENASKIGEQSGLFRMRDWSAEPDADQEKVTTQRGGRFTKRFKPVRQDEATDRFRRPKR